LTDKIGATAVNSVWLTTIRDYAKLKLIGDKPEKKTQRKLFDKYIDEGFVFMLVLLIRYAQLKSSDINSVSVVCCHDDVRIRNDY
jgi:hypothetical protein